MLNEDYRDMLRILSEEKVDFLLVGAYALAVHGYLRATMDIDLWVMPSPRNAEAVLKALSRFGAPLHEVTQSDFESEGTVFQIGIAPRRIDILTSVTGLEFAEVYARSILVNVDGIDVHVPTLDAMIANKTSTGRTRDLADVEALEAIRESQNND